ncbi:predicted protein [Uncinocarpus reesii 1704]|uniref:Cation/H+ exchanger transmembrane domain-containing protein n=1 Tax=Uncinocarpus reesii (strain UAMH 1704) TaxID=336963 RepID=C4JYP6_UNCRE|nr:uncharacterized protein UREG_07297 [Uncinocarpus reesii 1704]EEP82432.1 predicted protein [Uncinocarpus reesii 1704]
MADVSSAALAYHEPAIVTILIQSSFFIALNLINYVLDRLVYCGLVGQIFIAVPMGLSFSLIRLVSATPLQAFVAGAALSSTSLGTTFTILTTSGLTKTKLGTVLTSAAMMDDVVGLILIQVILNLSGSGASVSAVTIVRPLAVSLGFLAVLLLGCRFIVKPLTRILLQSWQKDSRSFLIIQAHADHVAFLIHTAVLIGLTTGAIFSGTSGLFAAYLAGVLISWWDSEFLTPNPNPPSRNEQQNENQPQVSQKNEESPCDVSVVLTEPRATASIGFAIPITRMFQGETVWRGFVYTALMLIGKAVTGLWLVRFNVGIPRSGILQNLQRVLPVRCNGKPNGPRETTSAGTENQATGLSRNRNVERQSLTASKSKWSKPRSLYPATIVGMAMVARGEIGMLIACLAESNATFSESSSSGSSETNDVSQSFLIVTWAILLCTIIGPIFVGTLVRRLNRLQKRREDGGPDPLGQWGLL